MKESTLEKCIFTLERQGLTFWKDVWGYWIFSEVDIEIIHTFFRLVSCGGITIEQAAKRIAEQYRVTLPPYHKNEGVLQESYAKRITDMEMKTSDIDSRGTVS